MTCYRKVEALGSYTEPREHGDVATIRLVHEEIADVGWPEHVSMVADMLHRAGMSDDMGDPSSVTLHVTWREDRR